MSLTPNQAEALARLAAWDERKDGCPSGPDISRAAGHKSRRWADGMLAAMERKGLVDRVGMTTNGARTWRATEAGKAALAQAKGCGVNQ